MHNPSPVAPGHATDAAGTIAPDPSRDPRKPSRRGPEGIRFFRSFPHSDLTRKPRGSWFNLRLTAYRGTAFPRVKCLGNCIHVAQGRRLSTAEGSLRPSVSLGPSADPGFEKAAILPFIAPLLCFYVLRDERGLYAFRPARLCLSDRRSRGWRTRSTGWQRPRGRLI